MESLKINAIYNTNETISKELLDSKEYPWEVLSEISKYILEKGKTLNSDEYIQKSNDIWIHKTANVYPSSYIQGPCIICKDAEIRHCAFIRGNVIIGEGAVVGNSVELKNVILFNKVQVPHYNYVGDSILGYKSHLGASSLTSNVKSDKTLVVIRKDDITIKTGIKKIGAFIGDNVEVGCGSILNPGTIIGKNSNIYPLSTVRGYVPENSIYKKHDEVVGKQ